MNNSDLKNKTYRKRNNWRKWLFVSYWYTVEIRLFFQKRIMINGDLRKSNILKKY